MYVELTRLIDDAKPLTRHVTGLDLLGESRGKFYIGIGVYDGDVTAVLPYQPKTTQVSGPYYIGMATISVDTTTVYPQP
jgi:P2-related tail formation protein